MVLEPIVMEYHRWKWILIISEGLRTFSIEGSAIWNCTVLWQLKRDFNQIWILVADTLKYEMHVYLDRFRLYWMFKNDNEPKYPSIVFLSIYDSATPETASNTSSKNFQPPIFVRLRVCLDQPMFFPADRNTLLDEITKINCIFAASTTFRVILTDTVVTNIMY